MPAKNNAKAQEAEQEAAQAEPQAAEGGRVRGLDALSPADRASAEQKHPFGYAGGPSIERGPKVASDFPAEATTGSVLPYQTDDIDVDSFDVRTVADIEEEKEDEAK